MKVINYFREVLITLKKIEGHLSKVAECVKIINKTGSYGNKAINTKHWNSQPANSQWGGFTGLWGASNGQFNNVRPRGGKRGVMGDNEIRDQLAEGAVPF